MRYTKTGITRLKDRILENIVFVVVFLLWIQKKLLMFSQGFISSYIKGVYKSLKKYRENQKKSDGL